MLARSGCGRGIVATRRERIGLFEAFCKNPHDSSIRAGSEGTPTSLLAVLRSNSKKREPEDFVVRHPIRSDELKPF
jgi:hypothetical protein